MHNTPLDFELANKTMSDSPCYKHIDVPFNLRHICWFCSEPSIGFIDFPKSRQQLNRLEHEPLAIPACEECSKISYSKDIRSIWVLRDHIKHKLIDKYAKHLGIGENWTEQELKESEFSGSLLGGFGESAWTMYTIARDRVAFNGWPVTIDEMPIDAFDEGHGFTYDGTRYLSLMACIDYYVKATGIDKDLFIGLIEIVSPDRFEFALKIAKLNKKVTPSQRLEILEEIKQQETDQEEITLENTRLENQVTDVEDVSVSGTIAPAFAIQWALSKGISNLEELCQKEDDYFDDFQHLGGPQAFMTYNGLQVYLDARQNSEWVEAHDPNKALWDK